MTVSIGVDVGSGVIKTALFRVEGEKSEWLSRWDARIRQRNTFALVEESVKSVLDSAGLAREDVDYVATTGEGESLPDATGHFYSMTTHARGALYLNPEARAVLDIGALHGRGRSAQFELASRLSTMAPGDLNYAFFCNSGSEAADTALKITTDAEAERIRAIVSATRFRAATSFRGTLPSAVYPKLSCSVTFRITLTRSSRRRCARRSRSTS